MDRKINIKNYEEFFIDYLDGNLSEKEIILLEEFLIKYPGLREELEGMENIKIQPERIPFSYTENIKQIDLSLPVGPENFDYFTIALQEGDLNEQQSEAYHEYLEENPEKIRDKEILENTRLKKDLHIQYNEKIKLKKSIFLSNRRGIATGISIAAGIALLFTVWTYYFGNNAENHIAYFEEKEAETAPIDTSSTVRPDNEAEDNQEINTEKADPKDNKKRISTFAIKARIPVAGADAMKAEGKDSTLKVNREEIIKKAKIDPRLLGKIFPADEIGSQTVEFPAIAINSPVYSSPDPDDYLSLQEFAVKKLTDIIFKEEDKELNVINLASKGVEKLNDVAGTNMQLEASAKEGSDKKILSFNSRFISFSTPINRED